MGRRYVPAGLGLTMTLALIMQRLVFVEVDGENSSLEDNFELSDAYRMQTREFVRSCLGLDDSTLDPANPAKPPNATVKSFEITGMTVRKAYSHG